MSKLRPSIMNLNSRQCSVASTSGAFDEKLSWRVPVISSSRMVASGGGGSVCGSFIASGSPATTTRAMSPVGDA